MARVAMVGSGHMAHALWEGWHRVPQVPHHFSLVVRSSAHRHLWPEGVWQQATTDLSVVEQADVIVVAVKPKDGSALLQRLVPYLGNRILVSPMAGWSISSLRREGVQGPIVRMMPNVCATVGASSTLVTFDGLDGGQECEISSFLAECGPVTAVEESLMNPYTALVGSGPAYIFLLLEALVEGGCQLGADRARTREVVSQMIEGTARLARDRSQDSLKDWIHQVASPGGTTEALLGVLHEAGWSEVIQQAVVAATERAQILGRTAIGE